MVSIFLGNTSGALNSTGYQLLINHSFGGKKKQRQKGTTFVDYFLGIGTSQVLSALFFPSSFLRYVSHFL